jgi:tRNA (cmo5U34)-methyltransferase
MPPEHGHFGHPHAAASYAVNARNNVPGLDDLHRMVMLLLAEQAPQTAHILVVGAGGGLETKAMAQARDGWRYTGLDPSPAMLEAARGAVEPFAGRVQLLQGTVDQAPPGPFDGATCLLVMHHLARDERLHTLREIRRRLKPGSRLVMVEHSAPGPSPATWLARSAAFGDRSGMDGAKARAAAGRMLDHLVLLEPEEEQSLLRQAGFSDVEMFYAAFPSGAATAPA